MKIAAEYIWFNKHFNSISKTLFIDIPEDKKQSESQEDIHPEESIYNKFTSNKDTSLFSGWHAASWKDKLRLI